MKETADAGSLKQSYLHSSDLIETMVWLHSCLDEYSCLLYGECLRNSSYGCCDMVMLVD
jgi:hypothetical protein